MEEQCETCRCYLASRNEEGAGACRLNPKQVVVSYDYWCSHWKPKKNPDEQPLVEGKNG